MKYLFSKHLLFRMPVSQPSDYSADQQLFLNDPFFCAAIRVATPVFYTVLERNKFRAASLSAKETVTLQKYVNRYCFRPTPFGLFASVTLVEWATATETTSRPAALTADIRVSMPFENLLSSYLLDHELQDKVQFEGNPSIYRVLNEYRFFRTGLDETGKRRDYQLQSIAFSKLLKALISCCQYGCSQQEVSNHIMLSAGCTPEEAADYTDFLIDAQLLVNQFRLPITGEDYLPQLAAMLNPGHKQFKLLNTLIRQRNNNTIRNWYSTGKMPEISYFSVSVPGKKRYLSSKSFLSNPMSGNIMLICYLRNPLNSIKFYFTSSNLFAIFIPTI